MPASFSGAKIIKREAGLGANITLMLWLGVPVQCGLARAIEHTVATLDELPLIEAKVE